MPWDMADRTRMLPKSSGDKGMAVSMELSSRIGWGSNISMFRPSAGRPRWVGQQSSSLPAHCKDSGREKGVVITTSEFSRDAIEYAGSLQTTIVLISGAQLAQLMIDYGVGVSEGETLKLKKLDEDYFGEE